MSASTGLWDAAHGGVVRALAAAPRVRAAVLADTHLRRTSARGLPAAVLDLVEHADVVLHAGDVVDEAVLDVLSARRPTLAVLGNNDRALVGRLPESLDVVLAGVRVAMLHDSGQARGRARRLARRFPDADVVVFGHSHIPWDERGPTGQIAFNPGSPVQRRRQPHHTAGRLDLADGAVAGRRILVVDPAGEDA